MALACAAILPTASAGWSPARAAARYTLRTEATYLVNPEGHAISVTVSATFTNTTPDLAAGYSSFTTVPLSLQAGASAIVARDRVGVLRVSTAESGSRTVATVALRSPARYQQSTSFAMTYRLADGAGPQIRVRPSTVVVPVWGFGTASAVTVRLPSVFAVRWMGASLRSAAQGDETMLSSAAISDPAHWLALLVAARPADYAVIGRTVPLNGGTVDLQVRAFRDDPGWGTATLDLATRALPALQDAIGLPYSGIGPLVITESLPTGSGVLAEAAGGAQQIAITFDASPFTVLHQLAHVWVGSSIASERWIREGLASHLAAVAAGKLKIAAAYDPGAEASARRANAIPLEQWGAPGNRASTSPDTGAWAYAASWAFVNELAVKVREDRLVLVVHRVSAGTAAYDGAGSDLSSLTGGPPEPLDSHRFLDQLEQVSGNDLTSLFRASVFPPAAGPLLDQRLRARAASAALLASAGSWSLPDPIRGDLSAWRFNDVVAAIPPAERWLAERNRLLDDARAAGLSVPGRLASSWMTDGGGSRARTELQAERAVVDAYLSAERRIDDLNPIEGLGVVGGEEPRTALAAAAVLYASGDLHGAAAAIARAVDLDAGAQGSGVVRLAAGVALLSVIAAALLLGLRRLRRIVQSFAPRETPPDMPPST